MANLLERQRRRSALRREPPKSLARLPRSHHPPRSTAPKMRASPRPPPEPSNALNENHDEAYSSSSTSPTCTFILAGSAYGASLDVARRALMLVVRLFALGEQEPFVNVMIDKVPRQQLVVDIVPSDEKIGIRQRRIFARLDFAMNPDQLVPDGPGAFTA